MAVLAPHAPPAPPESGLASAARALARENFEPRFGEVSGAFASDPVWAQLRAVGTQLWLDTGDLGEARDLWSAEFTHLTTNNTLVNREVQKGLFDAVIPEAARRLRDASSGIDAQTLLYEIGFVLNCRTALRLVQAFDAHVSVELHPELADDVPASVGYGRRYFAVCPERFIVKVPMTAAGFLAARQLAREGIPVNYTLGFSARQNYLAARFSRTRFVNVFMGRLNAFVIDNGLGDGQYVGEKATMATQTAVLELRRSDPGGPRLIGASMRAPSQVFDLAGLDVYTMPTAVARDYRREQTQYPRAVRSQIGREFEVSLAAGQDPAAVGIPHLWEIPAAVAAFADDLANENVDAWGGADFARAAGEAGAGQLFPVWSAADIAAIDADGKIPHYPRWSDRLSAGNLGLDSLMSISALRSFVTDQRQLDDHIRTGLVDAGLLPGPGG